MKSTYKYLMTYVVPIVVALGLIVVVFYFISRDSEPKLQWYVISPFHDQGLVNLKFMWAGTKATLQMSFLALLISICVQQTMRT